MADYNTNFMVAMTGHYDPGLEQPKKSSGGESGGPGDEADSKYQAPKGYKPSTPEQREKWNKFLDFLESKGVGGKKELDQRDQKLGLKYLKEYNKANPDNAISEDFIPTVQYESYLIRKKGTFPGLTANQAKYAFSTLSPQYKDKPISPMDSWLGSYTSRQYYPTFERGTPKGPQKFGTDFSQFVSGLSDEQINKSFANKQ